MSGFDTIWLDLREPADHAARDPGLARAACDWAARSGGGPTILDLGSGTGSTRRALAPHLPADVHWILLDDDPQLLAEASRRAEGAQRIETLRVDLGQVDAVPFAKADLVTASALFDLVSRPWLAAFVDRLVASRTALYAALSFDGRIVWDQPEESDDAVVAAFNRHQTSDKGLGAALGPAAGRELANMLTEQGWHVATAPSDWVLEPAHHALEAAFLAGLVGAVRETGIVPEPILRDWEAARSRKLGSGCRVGHLDLLARPDRA